MLFEPENLQTQWHLCAPVVRPEFVHPWRDNFIAKSVRAGSSETPTSGLYEEMARIKRCLHLAARCPQQDIFGQPHTVREAVGQAEHKRHWCKDARLQAQNKLLDSIPVCLRFSGVFCPTQALHTLLLQLHVWLYELTRCLQSSLLLVGE